MMLNCTTDKYAQLYARWVEDGEALLRWAHMTPGERVLDLCGGTGAVAEAAVRGWAGEVHLLDLNPRCKDPNVVQHQGAAEEADRILEGQSFSLVVCRQAIGYLRPLDTFRAVEQILAPRGRFVFNTFQQPPRGLTVKPYMYGGKPFLEMAYCWADHVVHLQSSPLIGADVTHFRWHDPKHLLAYAFGAGLKPTNVVQEGHSIRFEFMKKPYAAVKGTIRHREGVWSAD